MLSDIDFSGDAFRFDAKYTVSDRLALSMLRAHQIRRLKTSARCGCVAGFMVLMAKYGRAFFMPVAFAAIKYEAHEKATYGNRRAPDGTASFSLSELEQNSVEFFKDPQTALWDWHPALSKLVRKT